MEKIRIGIVGAGNIAANAHMPAYAVCDKAEVVALALEKLGVQDRRAAVMVGDRRHDVIGAHKNGVRACGVTFGYAEPGELEACGADRIASSAIELKEILLRFCRTQEL